ncbi:MAG: hypothetical protein DMG65_12370 [Candidatus Angelobacter sp. Gp1-AA117]|nr:MAG: hypothetical protein DMG65_12370 [Candidatus Angelobacter sp. Gp1-AA117]
MKKFFIPFLLVIAAAAQQAKPSPAEAAVTAELKQPATTDAPATTAAQPAKTEAQAKPAAIPALPVGTAIRLKLETPLYSGSTKPNSEFYGRVTEDIKLNDKVIIPVGSSLQGHVMQVSNPRRFKGKPMIQLKPESVTLPNGQKYIISAAVVDTNKINGTDVDDEGRIKGPGHTDRDPMEIGIGTGAGAVIGAIAGGARGSLIGAGIGAGGTLVHWLTKHNYAYLPAGSEIIFELSRPMTVTESH